MTKLEYFASHISPLECSEKILNTAHKKINKDIWI